MNLNRKTPPNARLSTHTQTAPRRDSGAHPFGLKTVKAAHTAADGRVFSYTSAFAVEGNVTRLVGRWHPGKPIPRDESPDAVRALHRSAEQHARAVLAGEPTKENPQPRPVWQTRKAA